MKSNFHAEIQKYLKKNFKYYPICVYLSDFNIIIDINKVISDDWASTSTLISTKSFPIILFVINLFFCWNNCDSPLYCQNGCSEIERRIDNTWILRRTENKSKLKSHYYILFSHHNQNKRDHKRLKYTKQKNSSDLNHYAAFVLS